MAAVLTSLHPGPVTVPGYNLCGERQPVSPALTVHTQSMASESSMSATVPVTPQHISHRPVHTALSISTHLSTDGSGYQVFRAIELYASQTPHPSAVEQSVQVLGWSVKRRDLERCYSPPRCAERNLKCLGAGRGGCANLLDKATGRQVSPGAGVPYKD